MTRFLFWLYLSCLLLQTSALDLSRRFLVQRVLPASAISLAWRPVAGKAAVQRATPAIRGSSIRGPQPSYQFTLLPCPYSSARQYATLTFDNGIVGLVCFDSAALKCELAATVSCGSMDDPPALEGLAHLAEHVTIAGDPRELNAFLESRDGDVNGFTGEQTTSFYAQHDVDPRNLSKMTDDFCEGCARFAALFSAGPCSAAVLAQEVVRIEAELTDIVKRPSKALIEIARLKSAAADTSRWRRLGRGGAKTLHASDPEKIKVLCDAVARMKAEKYLADGLKFAVISPVPLLQAIELVGDAFSSIPKPKVPAVRASRALSAPFNVIRHAAGGAMAIERPGRRSKLTLAYQFLYDDPEGEARSKALDLLGHALTEPHAQSLACALRARGLSPLSVVLDPVVTVKTVARVDGWMIWQVELQLAEDASSRWREAAFLAADAIKRMGKKGVPKTSITEAQVMSAAARQWLARPPTAVELASDLQRSGLVLSRTFAGEPVALAAMATNAALDLSSQSPIITLWTRDLDSIGIDSGALSPALPWPLDGVAKLLPLRLGPTTTKQAAASSWELCPPVANCWVPSTFAAPLTPMTQKACHFDNGVRVLQVPGCVRQRTLSVLPTRSQAALLLTFVEAMCTDTEDQAQTQKVNQLVAAGWAQPSVEPQPFAVAAIQIFSSRPCTAFAQSAAQAELWRLTLLQSIAASTSSAARAGLKCDLSVNEKGVRLLCSGYAQRLPQLMTLLLQCTLHHRLVASDSPELAAARLAAMAPFDSGRQAPEGTTQALLHSTPAEVDAAMGQMWGAVDGASLLLTGALSDIAAESLAGAVRAHLAPLLPSAPARRACCAAAPLQYTADPRARGGARSSLDVSREMSVEEALMEWTGLLYKPVYTSLAQNECLDPAVATALDQCGGI